MAIASTLEMYRLDLNFTCLKICPMDIHTHIHEDVCTEIFGVYCGYYGQRMDASYLKNPWGLNYRL